MVSLTSRFWNHIEELGILSLTGLPISQACMFDRYSTLLEAFCGCHASSKIPFFIPSSLGKVWDRPELSSLHLTRLLGSAKIFKEQQKQQLSTGSLLVMISGRRNTSLLTITQRCNDRMILKTGSITKFEPAIIWVARPG